MKVCVVGAGPSGLTTIKQLLDEGHEVVCFDKNADLGGIWYRHDGDADQMKAFDNLYLTVSMKLMVYSDFPHRGDRVFYTRAQYLDYLREYARRFGLAGHIRYGSPVTDLKRTGSGWTVTVDNGGPAPHIEDFDAVAVCTGPFRTPNTAIPELAGFTGEVVHSAQYRNNEPFRGKRVLVVGLAESGADIVREIGDVASECTLAIRSRSFLLPRLSDGVRTTDHGTVRSHQHEMLRRATDVPLEYDTFWGRSRIAKGIFIGTSMLYGAATTAVAVLRHKLRGAPEVTTETGLNPFQQPIEPTMLDLDTPATEENIEYIRNWNRASHPDGSWTQKAIFSKNVTFVPHLVSGRIALNDAGIASADGTTVRFKDGQSADFDMVMLCTGFTRDFTIGDLSIEDGNVRNLYKHFLHPDHAGTAAYIGLVRPFSGGIPICAEMQARYFARVLSGELSPPRDLGQRIERDRLWEEYWTSLSPTHTEAIPAQVLYLDSLASEIGCLMPWWKMVLNPKLFIQLWFGAFNQSSYRLVGPHNLGQAAYDDLYSEPVANRRFVAWDMSVLALMPPSVHPEHLM
ncbi:flavin-containing monooxygenase [Gordonia sp. VNK21]|uniref:flavin-containing monooxygenase n=1 Tax=Gordonia sp. VNK21 TaxID=3382483 RepID=UPI0038D37D2E